MTDTATLTRRMAFASIRGMGIDLAQKMLEVVGSEQQFFALGEKELKQLTGGNNRIYSRSYRNQCLAKAERELEFVERNNIEVIYFTDKAFPHRLLQAPDAPILLYSLGTCDLNAQHMISIVGTRKETEYGQHFVQHLVADLAQMLPGTVIVSGLAYGVDISAHRAALKHGLPTVGVEAMGLNKIYPAEHRDDAAAMVRHGGRVLTDYTSQDDVHRWNFVARNRIIAALSDCTVVVESAEKGGGLITANIAMSYNRDVFALPGRTGDLYSKGCNRLIQNNQAMLITCADDLLKAMRWEPGNQPARQLEMFPQLSREEQQVVDQIRQAGDIHINTLTERLGIPVYRLMGTLVNLDCRGIIITKPGCRYSMA